MSVQVTPHPAWVADLDATLDPRREAILDTPVIVHASENELVDGQLQNFLVAFSPTIHAVEGVAQKISEEALRGLAKNEKIGPRGRWWLEEHAKYDDEHPIHALEIIKGCVKRGEAPRGVAESALKSLDLMKDAMVA